VLYIHMYKIGYITRVTLESRQHNSGIDQSFPVFIRSGFVLQSFFSSFTFHIFSAQFLSSLKCLIAVFSTNCKRMGSVDLSLSGSTASSLVAP
jgi:hypothetical protein